ncbi:unnamed protein product [Paramecium primaurelia]|uniref:Uncharacterized protein n=1 Tax=Paramecium primaurelia TaxID=5886 RepID=A0A8S1P945_PARPR|nr:unnamed protein product [Paramecium primaurelia]
MNNQSLAKSAVERLNQSNFQASKPYEFENKYQQDQKELPNPTKFDLDVMLKFLDEVDSSVKQTHEYKSIIQKYKLSTSKFCLTMENDYLNNLPNEKKVQIYRDISRIYDHQEEAIELKDKVRKIITYKLEDMRRNTRESKWGLTLNLLQLLLNKNKGNRDIFDLFQKKLLPPDVRQLVWKMCLENKQISDEYSRLLGKARMLTMSKFDVQIIKDTEQIVKQMTKPDQFDGNMIFAMKTILSYYELKQDRILTDYLYLICIPLVYVFGTSKHLLKIPTELIGYFYSLQLLVQFFDPLVDLIVRHDEKYESEMTDLFMNSVNVLDEELALKFQSVLNLKSSTQRQMLVIIIKRFVHSLGFAFLPLDITLFNIDQMVMKIVKNKLEIFINMGIMCFCIRKDILACKTWDQIVDVFYTKAKLITLQQYHEYYQDVYKNVKFYVSPYDVDPFKVNRNAEFATDPLAEIIEKQQDKDINAFKKKWFEGKELYEEDDPNVARYQQQQQLPNKDKAIKDMKMQDAMKNVQMQQKPTQKLGMVPVQDSDEEEDLFDGMDDQ